jgi:ligand-binding sensor domain-containing protein
MFPVLYPDDSSNKGLILNRMKQLIYNIAALLILTALFIQCEDEITTSTPEGPPPAGFLFLSSDPPGTQIYLDHKNTGSKTPDSLKWLEEGTYQVTLKKKLFKDTTFTVEVREDIKTNVDIDYHTNPGMYGGIKCETEPDNALVILNDSVTNKYTPTTLNGLWPGNYKIVYAHENAREDSVFVTVESDKIANAYHELIDTTVWVSFSTKNSNIPSDFLTDIEIDNDGVIWIGSVDAGLLKFQNGIWINYTTENSPLPSNMVHCLKLDLSGKLWIGTNDGLASFNRGFWNIYQTSNSPLPSNRINCLDTDNSNLWMGTDFGLVRLNRNNWTVYNTEISNIPQNWVTSIDIDSGGNLWIGTSRRGIARLIVSTLKEGGIELWKTYNTDNEPVLPSNSISSVGIESNGHRWFGHDRTLSEPGGLSRLNRSARFGWEAYFQGLLFDTVFERIYFEGNIKWICTNNGLITFLDPDNPTTITANNSPLPHNHLKDLEIDNNRTMWIVSFGGGLIKYKR